MRKSKLPGIFLALILGVVLILALFWGLGSLPVVYAAAIIVNTIDDEYNSDGDCSLREAIAAANTNTAVDACGPGAGIDTIQFNLPTPAVIGLTEGQLTVNNQAVTIVGPGDDLLAISGNNTSRIFDVSIGIPITISGLTVRDGRTFYDGGGLRSGGAVTLIDATFVNNTAGDDGGAIDVSGSLTLSNTDILSNTAAGQGGGINSFGTSTTLNSGLFQNNQAGDIAGGLYADKALQIDGTQFVGNVAQNYAGAVWAWRSADVLNAYFAGNSAQSISIGAMYVRYNLALANTIFISNTARVNDGAILIGSDAYVTDGLFTGNVAETGRAGAIDAAGEMWITNTHFIANEAATWGGAVVHTGRDGSFVNSLFARNAADNGSALYLAHSGEVELLHVTIAGPEQPADNAIFINSSGTVTIRNTIIGGYTTGLEAAAGNVSEGYNLFFETVPVNGTVTRLGHSFSGDPAFVDSANDDYHLSANSEALNTGTNAGVLADGDGDARPGGSGVDIGYDETAYVSDVEIVKTVVTNPAAGESIKYTISFSNTGTALLPRLVLTDVIPAQVIPVEVISSGVAVDSTYADSTYVWNVNSLAPGQSGVITVSGTLVAPLPRGTFTNTVAATTIAMESDTTNNSAAASVTVPNFAPVAVDDVFTNPEDTAVTLTPLANDIDGDPLRIESFGQPAHGTAVLSGTEQIVYTPTLEFNGTDVFTYTVSDDEFTDTATITVNVAPVNDAPVITEGETVGILMSEDSSPTPFHLTLHATDSDNDPLSWSVTTLAAHGMAVVVPGPAVEITVTYTPTLNYAGTDLFVVEVTDGELSDSIIMTVVLDPVNDVPLAVDDVAVALRQRSDGGIKILAGGSGPGGSLNVISNDSDIEGSTLTIIAASAGEQGGIVNLDADGSLLSYSPAVDFIGLERFVYTVSDGELEDTAVISFTVTNGLDGGMSGDTFAVPEIGPDNAMTLTTEIPANGPADGNLALILDIPQTNTPATAVTSNDSAPAGFVSAGLTFSLIPYLNGQPVDSGHQFAEPITLTIDYAGADVAGIGPGEQSLGLYFWQADGWVESGIQLVERDTARHRLVITVDHAGTFALFRRASIFLPLVANNYVAAPDLVVESLAILASGEPGGMAGDVQVVIKNVGTRPVTTEFWVDVYINPHSPPTVVNQTWGMVGDEGLVWGVATDSLPINPGETLTLALDSPYYESDLSYVKWPLTTGVQIYAQVDSVDTDTTTGTVLEIHEITGAAYNNIFKWP